MGIIQTVYSDTDYITSPYHQTLLLNRQEALFVELVFGQTLAVFSCCVAAFWPKTKESTLNFL